MMINDRSTPITAEDRGHIRRAIKNDVRWNAAFRQARGLEFSSMPRAAYFDVCDEFGIDIKFVLSSAREQEATQNMTTYDHNGQDMTREEMEVLRARAVDAAQRDGAVQASSEFKTDAQLRYETSKANAQLRWQYADTRQGNAQIRYEADRAAQAKADFDSCPNDASPKAVQTPDDAGKAAQLLSLLSDLTGKASMDEDAVKALARATCEEWIAANPMMSTRIELTVQGETVRTVDGHQHPAFTALLRAANARDVTGYAPNIWISGPAGSGKTHGGKMVAKALGVPFHFNGALSMAHELLGFIDAGGNYHETEFRKAYEGGGVYLFDEVDGSDNSALLALNAALANGQAAFPDTIIGRHSDCRILATGNTWGHGATAEYVGRSKIDAAFLSRFPVKIEWNYDDELERAICGNSRFADRVQKARRAAASCSLKVLITPRDSIAGAALIAAGFSEKEAADMTYLASLTPDQRRMIETV